MHRLLIALFALTLVHAQERTYENLDAVLWTQAAVEYRANALQAYRVAKENLLRALDDEHWTAALEQSGNFGNLPPAVILDLDETVLDNTAFNAGLVARSEKYTEDAWRVWVKQSRAGAVPGAIEFLNFAHAHGVTPVYITNRECDGTNADDPTVRALRRLNAPNAPLYCKDTQADNPEDKTRRRAKAAASYRILLVVGDNFYDFISQPKQRLNSEERVVALGAYASYFGERWIIIPNPFYGSWESPIGRSLDQKLKALRQ
jgi:5'-nucleotidase (lipoprotein e(P4) family)